MEYKVLRQLNIHYFASIAVLAVLFVLAILKIVRFSETPQAVSLTVEMYAVVITLVAIPILLKTFAERLKKIKQAGANPSEATRQYKMAYFVRLYALAFVTVGNIVLYALSRNQNFLWLTVALFVIFLFCKSSEKEIFSLTETGDNPQKQEE
ncbi:MAG: hypothetical protein LBS52_04255 [Dysgonamonadaceae bacterium]|jgi:DMSO reductase anchor subunit|nr:hypothetical protein [Dysgonamonadaceae bacterium]